MKKTLLLILFCWISNLAIAQYFQTGQDPASIKWRQIHTANFQLIYPDYYEDQAQKLAGKMEAVYHYGSFSHNYKPRKISVILHTQTVKSNGLVAWAPKRAEFYTTPHQEIYPQDWLEQLALHEFRHVVQVDKVNSLLPGIVNAVLGQQGTALVFGGYLPWWFIEGDAIIAETALSNYGRGRFPSFLMEHRAQVVEKGVFSYDKAYFGSYHDFVPNHYKLGYYMVGSARAKYGAELWEKVLNRVGSKPFSVFPVNQVLKKETGLKKETLYESVFNSLQSDWIASDESYEPNDFEPLTSLPKYFASYNYNHWLNDSTCLSYKTSYDEIPSFIKIDLKGNEEKFFKPGPIFNESVSYRGNWIIWSEQIPDLRWEHSGKSLLRFYNVKTNQQLQIKPEFKSFSPALSKNVKKLVVVETDFSNNYYLSVYYVPQGKRIERFQSTENNYFFSPVWLNLNEVAAIILSAKGKQLVKINFQTNEMEQMLNEDLGDLKHLVPSDNYLYFVSSYSAKNSLYRYNFSTRLVERIYEPRFGIESPAVSADGSKIVLSDYTADGFRLISIPAKSANTIPLSEVKKGEYPLAEALSEQESGKPDFSGTDTVSWDSKKYSKPAHLFNFHSWAPLFIDAGAYDISPGVSLMSQNKLGTAETVLGYKWDIAEKSGQFYGNYTFQGWYPKFDFELSSGNRRSEYMLIEQTTDKDGNVLSQDTTSQQFTWGELRTGTGISFPFNLSKGKFNRYLQPEIQYNFTSYKRHSSTPERFTDGNFHTLSYRFYYHQLLRKSYHDMYPDFGFVLDGAYRHSVAGTLNPGNVWALQSVIYMPGLLNSHGIKLYGGTQKTSNDGTLGFSDMVRYARNWGKINTTGLSTVGVDYKFPLFYPDWNMWGLLYVRRVKMALFGDFSRLKGNFYHHGEITGTFVKDISSFGTEITSDVNLLRFYAPADIGFRASWIPEMKDVYFDFLFSIDFNSF
jgi:hypothetical protein